MKRDAAPVQLYRLKAASEATGISVDILRKAIHATDPESFPPPLRAKRIGTEAKFVYAIPAHELTRWVNQLPDA